ncbi:Cytoskeleton-associated protein, Gly-rich domain protein [Metarhizium album ARSEF 1941]|uniref:Cytoskeleton-associated protein, Gly-rich domain protein n=1 Tax=Metarhizium album (strain ARSEF 1941) TaxID=1081103 RepID=A0A0B2WJV2_METAS|nr:Cytoskeleton-associated protein, Gly-rich domain protein [Metarhizium album ARSEF 1941]KHN96306.1 Cytoskeleton-associated protein, Gly-rich domain protein [Metarhizium album ARSEF 1941]
MASTTTTTTTFSSTSTRALRSRPSSSRLRGPASFVSTPNLNTLFVAQSKLLPPGLGLSRRTSLAALTPSSLASIPDVSESYALDTVLSDSSSIMAPATPGRQLAEDLVVGDAVDVPGGMHGTVRFVGAVQGKKGTFAGVELHQDFVARGKNNGDVDGVSYFTTSTPGAGIFVPVVKASRRGSPTGSFPMTPTASTNGRTNGTHYTPPGLPKFSASIGPGARAPSPGPKRPPRTSLPRPDSPVRRTQMTPVPRPSIGTPAPRPPARYGSPTNNGRFTQSVRGTAGDPNKKPSRLDRKPSISGPRSSSALGSISGFEEESTPSLPGSPQRLRPNGLGNAGSIINLRRPASRANAAKEEEMERLRSQLEDRDRQLKDQAATLADMESSLVELQGLIESTDMPGMKRNSLDDKDSTQLRVMLREKNDKIAMLTAEFDAHRADLRSTIDTLEMASTETERVYEKRIEELMGDIRELEARNLDVDSVASQLRQLEELVQELEEGLEDARRGEAEARGEAEFLRGEVERTKTELRRAREQSASGGGAPHDDKGAMLKELEQKEDEIRGLKAIIHSLSRDSIGDTEDRTPTQRRGSFMNGAEDGETARASLASQVAELQSLLDKKNGREEELVQELEALRGGNLATQTNSGHRSSLRDSRDTVIPVRSYEPVSSEVNHKREPNHKRGTTLDSMHESDAYSTATENSTLWCEICETSGHDILACTNMFGPEGGKAASDTKTAKDVVREGMKHQNALGMKDAHPAPLSPAKPRAAFPAAPAINILPNPMESGPLAGKESGVVDTEKWCAVCERDGHDSVDCPFEDAF